MHIRFLVPGNVRHGSGGNKYNAKLAEHLTALGAKVETITVDGDWPVGSPADRQRFADMLDGGTTVIADGLVASGAPDEISGAVSAGTQVWILSHMALADHPDLEAKALAAATGIICPSAHAAGELRAKHGTQNIVIATPGAEKADSAEGSQPLHIVAVAALLPNKSQLELVECLATLQDVEWTAALIGSENADPRYAAEVRAAVEHYGLDEPHQRHRRTDRRGPRRAVAQGGPQCPPVTLRKLSAWWSRNRWPMVSPCLCGRGPVPWKPWVLQRRVLRWTSRRKAT